MGFKPHGAATAPSKDGRLTIGAICTFLQAISVAVLWVSPSLTSVDVCCP